MNPWSLWHYEHSEARGVHIDVRFAHPVTARDIERIEALCALWKQIAAEDEAVRKEPAHALPGAEDAP